jgi:uncharacterized membrane protein
MATELPNERQADRPTARATARSAADSPELRLYTPTAAMAGGLFLGLGAGGFIDGIVFHQIAQWHNMGSAILPPVTMEAMSQNMRWDGLFHILALALTLLGALALWREGQDGTAPPRLRVLLGQMLLGWGLFNLVEGVVDHHLLELHHVRDMPLHVPLYDWAFLGVGGLLFIAIGWLMSRTKETDFLY